MDEQSTSGPLRLRLRIPQESPIYDRISRSAHPAPEVLELAEHGALFHNHEVIGVLKSIGNSIDSIAQSVERMRASPAMDAIQSAPQQAPVASEFPGAAPSASPKAEAASSYWDFLES